MADPANRSRGQYVYRRIHPYHWDVRKSRLKRGAFVPRANTQLSVCRSDLQTPRGLMQHCLNDWQQRLASDDADTRQAAAENLRRYGGTPEEMVRNGWRVAELPIAAFTDQDFTFDGPESDGHQNAQGDYALHSGELARIARILSEDECRGSGLRPACPRGRRLIGMLLGKR